MNRIPLNLNYIFFGIACLVVVVTFITATSFIQLTVASLLYPALIFLAYKVLPLRTGWPALKGHTAHGEPRVIPQPKAEQEKRQSVGIADIDKRAFLKLIGATGLSFFLISIFGRRFETLLFGQNIVQVPTGYQQPGQPSATTASPTEGYNISEIDNGIVGFYGFTNKDGRWLIMKEDREGGSFRYAKGESNFAANWRNRENLKYDYFHDLSF